MIFGVDHDFWCTCVKWWYLQVYCSFFQKFWYLGLLGGACYRSKIIVSPGLFFHFFKIVISWLVRVVKWQKAVVKKWQKLCASCSISQDQTSYDCHLWYTCVTWCTNKNENTKIYELFHFKNKKKSRTCEDAGSHLKISFWHLLIHMKNKIILIFTLLNFF